MSLLYRLVISMLIIQNCVTTIASLSFSEEPIDTIAMLGEDIRLNCSFDNWFFENLEWNKLLPTNYDITKGTSILEDNHVLLETFGTGLYSLGIINTTEEHEGLYQCIAWSSPNVESQPSLYLLDDDHNNMLTLTITKFTNCKFLSCAIESGPYYNYTPSNVIEQEESIEFYCEIEKAVPPGELVWLRDDNIEVFEDTTLILIWDNVFVKEDNGTVMRCCLLYETLPASEEYGENCGEDITLIVQYPAIVDTSNNSTEAVIEGEDFHASCSIVEGSNPPTITDWYWKGPYNERYNGSQLTLRNVSRDSWGDYTCFVENDYLDDRTGTGSSTIQLDVQYLPDITTTDHFVEIEGRNFTANCSAIANPTANIQWYDDPADTIHDTPILELLDIDRYHSGNYTCYANNVFWDGREGVSSDPRYLDVQYWPSATIIGHFTVIEGSTFEAYCDVDANPTADIYWLDDEANQFDGGNIVIADIQRQQDGYYTCFADNLFWDGTGGNDTDTQYLDVQYIPSVTTTDRFVEVEGRDFTANCTADSNPAASIHWLDETMNSTHDGPLLELLEIDRHQSGNYICIANTTFWDGSEVAGSETRYLDIQYQPSVTIEGDLVAVEGNTFTAYCDVDANPTADIAWYFGGSQEHDDALLEITNIQRHQAGNYTCTGQNIFWDGTTGTDYEFHNLDVQYSPSVTTSTRFVEVEGRDFTALCSADSNPPARIQWVDESTGNIHDGEELNMVEVERQQSGDYTCVANITFWDGSHDTDSETRYLDIQYSPSVNITGDHQLIEGEFFTAFCYVDANPSAVITWSDDHEGEYDGGLLQIDDIERTQGGTYTCLAQNEFWDGTDGIDSEMHYLDVQYHPDVTIQDDNTNAIVIEGQEYMATCSVDSNPEADNIKWIYVGDDVIIDGLTLTIQSATKDQHGSVYTCQANNTFYTGDMGQDTPHVNISLSGDPVVIEGSEYRATCSADGNPEPSIEWLYDERDVRFENLTLIIDVATRDHHGTYTCEASNTFHDDTIGHDEESFDLDIQYAPTIDISGLFTVIEGQNFNEECSADANPNANIFWSDEDMETVGDEGRLDFDNIQRTSSGNYMCTATNTFWDGTNGDDTESRYLDVQYPPTTDVLNLWVAIKEGESVTLSCDVTDGNPIEVDYTWTLSNGTEYNNAVVNLVDVTRVLHGDQICTATNTYYDGSHGDGTNTTYLDIQYFPEVEVSDIIRKKSDPVTLNCIVDSNPHPHSYSWTKDGDHFSDEQSVYIESADESDSGEYTCTATNEFYDGSEGQGYGIMLLTVEYLSSVKMVVLPSHNITEGDDVKIECEAEDGLPDPSKMSLYFNDDIEPIIEVEGGELEYNIYSITGDKGGLYQCRAYTVFYDDTEDYSTKDYRIVVSYFGGIINDPEKETNFTVSIGGNVTMTCTADSNPISEIQWYDDGGQINDGEDINKHVTDPKEDGTLVTSNLIVQVESESYYGVYVCEADNGMRAADYSYFTISGPTNSTGMDNFTIIVYTNF
ncbi:hemicentin-1-like [Glandiceps talaboti]